MKKLLTLITSVFCLLALNTSAQITLAPGESVNRDNDKMAHRTIPVYQNPQSVNSVIHPVIHPSAYESQRAMSSTGCSGMFLVDPSFTIVAFDGSGGNGGPGVPPEYRNDDWSTIPIALPFSFCFYGTNTNTVFINNNGNISFNGGNPIYTPNGFPDGMNQMIAPFWSDVDTRHPLSGLVYYKVTPTALIVIWDHVSYYNAHYDLFDSFQLIITDGTDPLVAGGNNVSFTYGDMQWTTGDASGGVNGFGGAPATVGANKGDNINYIQFGQFVMPGNSYVNNVTPGGIDYLDNRSFVFSTCNSSNIPPVVNWLTRCDTIHICTGDTLTIPVQFLSPEAGQITTATATSSMTGFSILSSNPGNIADITAQVVASASNVGYNTITFSATDDGTPAATTNFPITLWIDSTCSCSAQFSLYADTLVQHEYWLVNLASGTQPLTYDWNWGDGSPDDNTAYPSHTYATAGNYNICLGITDANGCTSSYCYNSYLHRPDIDNTMVYVNVISSSQVGISENNASSFSIYPNPVSAETELFFGNEKPHAVQITNSIGEVVLKEMTQGSRVKINTAGYSNGIYFIEVTDEAGSKTLRKIVKL